ncbi:M15 family metallopeptidase [soil metagenome]
MRWILSLLAVIGTGMAQTAIEHDLVRVDTISPPPLQEIHYATPYNFTGQQLYPFAMAYVNKDVAVALQEVQKDLQEQGLGLKIYDGYRPLSVQQKMWDLIHDDRYVSNPAKNKGKHTRGTAVDVTLVDHLGNDLVMPTPFDDFTDKAHRKYPGLTKEQKENSAKLEAVMVKHGFVPFLFEWWHFDYASWEKYPPLDISFDDLAKGVKTTIPAP